MHLVILLVVGDYINAMKTTFDLNFDLDQTVNNKNLIKKSLYWYNTLPLIILEITNKLLSFSNSL